MRRCRRKADSQSGGRGTGFAFGHVEPSTGKEGGRKIGEVFLVSRGFEPSKLENWFYDFHVRRRALQLIGSLLRTSRISKYLVRTYVRSKYLSTYINAQHLPTEPRESTQFCLAHSQRDDRYLTDTRRGKPGNIDPDIEGDWHRVVSVCGRLWTRGGPMSTILARHV